MRKKIPDRWEAYKPIGRKIEGTRFIAFKVPLREDIAVEVEIGNRLDDKILLRKIPNLGLIIDLTNTDRYYNPWIFEKEGIEYKKLMIPGQATPHNHLAEYFIKIVKDFLKRNKNNDKLIGVHCTHGVNRTGYLICYYMISEMTIKAKDAIRKFEKARGYGIERRNYIQNLQELDLLNNRNMRKPEEVATRVRRMSPSSTVGSGREMVLFDTTLPRSS